MYKEDFRLYSKLREEVDLRVPIEVPLQNEIPTTSIFCAPL